MTHDNSMTVRNGQTFQLSDAAPMPIDRFRDDVIHSLAKGGRIAAFFAQPYGESGFQIIAVIALDQKAALRVFVTTTGPEYPSHHNRLPTSTLV